MINKSNFQTLKAELEAQNVKLVAISKTHDVATIQEVYDLGQRIFGENKAQEISEKQPLLPGDIEWHFVGHLQTNKVKAIAPFVSMIHSVDRKKLLKEIQKEAQKNGRVIHCLIQVHIATDESKFGLPPAQVNDFVKDVQASEFPNIRICGLMGIATLTEDREQIRKEFEEMNALFTDLKQNHFSDSPHFSELSMGMTSDYDLAIDAGSTMVRVGSYIFGQRN